LTLGPNAIPGDFVTIHSAIKLVCKNITPKVVAIRNQARVLRNFIVTGR